MSVGDLLLTALVVAAVPNWIVAFILTRAALRKPRIRFLTMTAALSDLIAIIVGLYVLAVLNARADYIVSVELARVILRSTLLVLAAFPIYWLRVYYTRGFRDEE